MTQLPVEEGEASDLLLSEGLDREARSLRAVCVFSIALVLSSRSFVNICTVVSNSEVCISACSFVVHV